jgi:hypothetical protein
MSASLLDSASRLGPVEEEASTSQGHPHTIFRPTLEHKNLLVAEATAKEIGRVSLEEALEMRCLAEVR